MLSPRSTGAARARLLSSPSSSSASGGLAPRFAGGGYVGYQNPGGYEDPGVVREGKKILQPFVKKEIMRIGRRVSSSTVDLHSRSDATGVRRMRRTRTWGMAHREPP